MSESRLPHDDIDNVAAESESAEETRTEDEVEEVDNRSNVIRSRLTERRLLHRALVSLHRRTAQRLQVHLFQM
jgi:hypothetical protein